MVVGTFSMLPDTEEILVLIGAVLAGVVQVLVVVLTIRLAELQAGTAIAAVLTAAAQVLAVALPAIPGGPKIVGAHW